jgi:pimeloyl-ACP methyl ester carboxylesterase/DNA-binding CsgD family transcriptional regulator
MVTVTGNRWTLLHHHYFQHNFPSLLIGNDLGHPSRQRKTRQVKQQIRFCTTDDGVRIAYATTGAGPPLVKASNWLSHLEFDWDSPVWRHWLTELSRDHTLLRYDKRGCGLSDWNVAELSFEAWVHDLETVIDAAGIDRFPLLGISQGASIAVTYAVRHPDRVSHLILYGGYSRGWLKRDLTAQERKVTEMMGELAELGWGGENPAFRQFFTTQFIPEGTPEQHHWFNELERISTSPHTAAQFFRIFNEIDVTGLAPKVRCPTLVLHADRDARVPFDEGRLFASLIPGARFVPLDSRNHILLEHEAAWGRWVDEVRSFLPAVSPGGPAFASLTPRESALVELIAQGLDNAQIAARLDLSEKTIRNRITSIFDKLEVETRSQAIVRARDAGFGKQPR